MVTRKILAVGAVSCALSALIHPITSAAQSAQEEPTWFAIMGNADDASVDTVEIDVSDIGARGFVQNMDLRVNLAHQRTMDTGEKYTSYQSVIAIDCGSNSIFHITQTRFVGPLWTGAQTTQSFSDNRPMAFGNLSPSPSIKILKAACAQ